VDVAVTGEIGQWNTMDMMGRRNHIVKLAVYFQNHLPLWRDNGWGGGGGQDLSLPRHFMHSKANTGREANWTKQTHNTGDGCLIVLQLQHAEIRVNTADVFHGNRSAD
jgi:hypothetical protein